MAPRRWRAPRRILLPPLLAKATCGPSGTARTDHRPQLHTGAMHKCVYFKEVFWNYSALRCSSRSSRCGSGCNVQVAGGQRPPTLGLLWWIYTYDAFDSSDTTQVEKFIGLGKDPMKAPVPEAPQDDQQKISGKSARGRTSRGRSYATSRHYMLFNIARAEPHLRRRSSTATASCWVILPCGDARDCWLEGGFTAKNALLRHPHRGRSALRVPFPSTGSSPPIVGTISSRTWRVSLTVYTACSRARLSLILGRAVSRLSVCMHLLSSRNI